MRLGLESPPMSKIINKLSENMQENYSIKVITSVSNFALLKDEWNRLSEKTGPYRPFLCFDWYEIWLKHFLADNQLFVIAISEENEIKIALPCLLKRLRWKGLSLRRIELIGNVYSPFRYFLFNGTTQDDRSRHLHLILDDLKRNFRGWDILEFGSIPEENGFYEVIKMGVEKTGLKLEEFACYGDWYNDAVDPSGEIFFSKLPSGVRKDILYCKRRLEKSGDVEFKIITRENIEEAMNDYYVVYSKSWQEKEGIGPNFHRDLGKMAGKNGWLRLGFLRFNNQPIAAQFWMKCDDHAFILKTVYDQEFKKYSPGKILTSEMVKSMIDIDKVGTIDYVQGDETYKKDWTPKRRERKGIRVFNDTLRGRYAAVWHKRIMPAIKRNIVLKTAKDRIKDMLSAKA